MVNAKKPRKTGALRGFSKNRSLLLFPEKGRNIEVFAVYDRWISLGETALSRSGLELEQLLLLTSLFGHFSSASITR